MGMRVNENRRGPMEPNQEAVFLPDWFQPSDKDVVCGWARQHQRHAGNERFRKITQQAAPLYDQASSKLEKTHVIAAVVDKIRRDSPGGGFVKQDPQTGLWFEIGDDKARDKVGHAIRRCLDNQSKADTSGAVGFKNRGKLPNEQQAENQDIVMGDLISPVDSSPTRKRTGGLSRDMSPPNISATAETNSKSPFLGHGGPKQAEAAEFSSKRFKRCEQSTASLVRQSSNSNQFPLSSLSLGQDQAAMQRMQSGLQGLGPETPAHFVQRHQEEWDRMMQGNNSPSLPRPILSVDNGVGILPENDIFDILHESSALGRENQDPPLGLPGGHHQSRGTELGHLQLGIPQGQGQGQRQNVSQRTAGSNSYQGQQSLFATDLHAGTFGPNMMFHLPSTNPTSATDRSMNRINTSFSSILPLFSDLQQTQNGGQGGVGNTTDIQDEILSRGHR